MARLAFDSWLRATQQMNGPVRTSTSAKVVVINDAGLDQLKRMMEPGFFEEIMREFLEEQIVGPQGALYKAFHVYEAKPEYYLPRRSVADDMFTGAPLHDAEETKGAHDPYADLHEVMAEETDRGHMFFDETAGLDIRNVRPVRSAEPMFAAVWNVLKQYRVWTSGTTVIGGVGPIGQLLALKLGPYMPVQGGGSSTSAFDSLFMALEYGTGIAENVGGPQWVRHDGPTKEADGSWWLGPEAGHGVHFLGQRGLHFLDDVRTRQPLAIYMTRLEEALPQLVAAKLTK